MPRWNAGSLTFTVAGIACAGLVVVDHDLAGEQLGHAGRVVVDDELLQLDVERQRPAAPRRRAWSSTAVPARAPSGTSRLPRKVGLPADSRCCCRHVADEAAAAEDASCPAAPSARARSGRRRTGRRRRSARSPSAPRGSRACWRAPLRAAIIVPCSRTLRLGRSSRAPASSVADALAARPRGVSSRACPAPCGGRPAAPARARAPCRLRRSCRIFGVLRAMHRLVEIDQEGEDQQEPPGAVDACTGPTRAEHLGPERAELVDVVVGRLVLLDHGADHRGDADHRQQRDREAHRRQQLDRVAQRGASAARTSMPVVVTAHGAIIGARRCAASDKGRCRTGLCRVGDVRRGRSAQAGDVVGDRLDLAVVHLARRSPVICGAVGARAAAEGDQLRLGVVGVLAGQARVLRRDAGAVGAVAAGAGRHLLVGDAAAVDLLAQRRPGPCSSRSRAWPACCA